jgi:hypothetical protein
MPMRLAALLTWLPDDVLPLVIVGVCLALVLGVLSGRGALQVLGLLLLIPLLAPLIDSMLEQLPAWLALTLPVAVGLSLLRLVASFFLGSRAADTMVGSLAASAVIAAVRLVFLPIRVAGAAARVFLAERLR